MSDLLQMYCVTLYLFFIEMMAGQIGQIGWKSIEMMPGQIRWLNLTDSTRQAYNVISMDLHPIRPPNMTDLTRQAYNAISMDFHPIKPPNSTRQAYNVISMDLHPIQPPNLTSQIDWHLKPLTGIQCNFNGFPPNLTDSTSRIGWKSIEITLYACPVKSVELGG